MKVKKSKRVITNDFLNKSIGLVIRNLGVKQGETVIESANRIGVSYQVYYKMIKGKKILTFVEVYKVMNAYNVTPVSFYNQLEAVKLKICMRMEC